MSPYWNPLYDGFKDRRYAALFLIALGALVVSPVLLPVIGMYGLAQGVSAFRLARANRRNKLRYSSLSRDELRLARSKLLNNQSRKGV